MPNGDSLDMRSTKPAQSSERFHASLYASLYAPIRTALHASLHASLQALSMTPSTRYTYDHRLVRLR